MITYSGQDANPDCAFLYPGVIWMPSFMHIEAWIGSACMTACLSSRVIMWRCFDEWVQQLGKLYKPQPSFTFRGGYILVTALLVYKFLHSGTPDYFTPYLKPKKFTYMSRSFQLDGIVLDVPHPTYHQKSLVTASVLMPLLYGMIFRMKFALPPHSHLLDAS